MPGDLRAINSVELFYDARDNILMMASWARCASGRW